MIRKILLSVLCAQPLLASAQSEAFLPLPPGYEILVKTDKGPVPLAFLSVPFASGWRFRWHPPVFEGMAPDTTNLTATFVDASLNDAGASQQRAMAEHDRQRLPDFLTKYASRFGNIVHPCIEEAQGKERYRFVCTAERTMNGVGKFLVAYAYLDPSGTLFLNFTGDGDPVSARERAEVILAKARWRNDASKVITMPVH